MTSLNVQHIDSALRVFVGPQSLDHLERELARSGSTKAVVLCGKTLSRSPLLELVVSRLGSRGVGVVVAAEAHSPRPAVEAAVGELRRRGADAMVAVGGGSAVVTARAAAILLAEARELRELSTSLDATGNIVSPRLSAPKLPQIVVPTTPNTAIVKAGAAVYDPTTAQRFALYDPKTRPASLFVDPDLLMSAPQDLVVSAALDTLSLAIEGLLSRTGDALSDASLIHAVRLLCRDLRRLSDQDGPGLRTSLTMAAVLCGRGTDHTGAGIATVLGHAIGATHDVGNGFAKAAVLSHALEFNLEFAGAGLEKVATALGVEAGGGEAVIGHLTALLDELGVAVRLRDLGIPSGALDAVAERGMADWFLRGNPRPVNDASELERVLRASW